MKELSILIIFTFIVGHCYAQKKTSLLLHYETSAIEPINLDSTSLVEIVGEGVKHIVLKGHTDDIGSNAFNLELSKQRVEHLRDYLLLLNVKKDIIQIEYYGEELPLEENVDDRNRSINRRVEIIIYFSEELPEKTVLPIDTTSISDDNDVGDNSSLYAYLRSQSLPQIFTISNSTDTVIETKDGVLIYFPEACFDTRCDSTRIAIEAFNDKKSMVLSNIQTLSNDRLIYSDGMLDIKAFCDGKEVKLRRRYTMLFPVNLSADESDAIGFYGYRDSLTNQVNWMPSSSRSLDIFGGSSFWACGNNRTCPVLAWFFSREKKWERALIEELDKERERIRKKYKDVDFDKFGEMPKSDVKFYVFQANRTGLINVDRYWYLAPENFINQRIELAETITKDCDVMMVFRGRRSLISSALKMENYFEFLNVPRGEEVQIVALKLAKDGKIKLKVEKVIIGSEDVVIALDEVESMDRMDAILGTLE